MGDGEDVTVQSALESAVNRLRSRSDTPELDAQVLLANVLKKPRSWLAAHPESLLGQEPTAALEGQIQRLEHGEPLPYVLGEWEFYGLPFHVTPDVLIPRPETELLIEHAITWLRKKTNVESRTLQVADIGTGSGCIAISLAVIMPEIQVTATDISSAALAVARQNAEHLNVAKRINFINADLFPDPFLPSPFSLIVANLPYIPTSMLQKLPIFNREPSLALDGGVDGLNLIRRLLKNSVAYLAPDGMMLLEIEASQGQSASAVARDLFPQASVKIHQDLSGHDRLLEVQR